MRIHPGLGTCLHGRWLLESAVRLDPEDQRGFDLNADESDCDVDCSGGASPVVWTTVVEVLLPVLPVLDYHWWYRMGGLSPDQNQGLGQHHFDVFQPGDL